MSLKKLLIVSYVFYAFYKSIAFKLDDLVDEQEGIAVRQDFGDLPDIKKGVGAESAGAFPLANLRMVAKQ